MEFYKIYYNFKVRRHGFEKIFKRSRSNVLAVKRTIERDATVFIKSFKRTRRVVSRWSYEKYFLKKNKVSSDFDVNLLAYSSFIVKNDFYKNFYKEKHFIERFSSTPILIIPRKHLPLFAKNFMWRWRLT